MKLPAFSTRDVIGLILVLGFMAAYFREATPDQMMKGALVGAFATAYGYWLGSSKGSSDKNTALSQLANAAADPDDAAPPEPPQIAPAAKKK